MHLIFGYHINIASYSPQETQTQIYKQFRASFVQDCRSPGTAEGKGLTQGTNGDMITLLSIGFEPMT